MESHTEFLRAEEADPELVEAIKKKRWRELDLPARDRALAEVAEKMSATPTRMTERDWQPLRDLGLDDQALLEVGHIVGIFNYLTRMADAFGIRLDEPVDGAATALRDQGLTAGAVAAVQLPNVWEHVVLELAIPLLEAVVMPLPLTLGEAELTETLRRSGAAVLLT